MSKYSIDSLLSSVYADKQESHDLPVIGITTNAGGEDYSLRQRYCTQVIAAGGVPMLLAPVSPDTDSAIMAQQLDLVDAVIFTGGGDHNPLWMGEDPLPELHSINTERDRHELALCRLAYNRNLPMLGICRGMQTITIALDGHVAQDITACRLQKSGKRVKHSQDAPKTEATHSISINSGTVLHSLYGDTLLVNSFHHQAVDNPGPRFRIAAAASDGVIEAIESAEFRSIMGVQWHPEQLGNDALPLFQWLVGEASLLRKAKALHAQMLTIDSHCDTPMFFPQNIDFLSRDPRILYDLHKMHDGHIDAVNMVCYLPQPKIGEKFSDNVAPITHPDGTVSPATPLAYADYVFDKIEDICNRSHSTSTTGNHGVVIARHPSDLYRDKRDGRHSIMLGIENGMALEHDLRNLQHLAQRGITYITLCHNGDNDICDSARGCNTHSGLSSFGVKVVEEMNRLGIMVDLSHAAESTFWHTLEVSKKPVVCSHSCCRALCDHPRNITDEQMRALAEKGGVMQLTMYPGFLVKDGDATIIDFLSHLEHAISIMGIDHVGIGTDFDGDGGITGVSNAAELINVTMHLLRRGYSHQDIEKIWGKNWLRVMSIVKM